MTKAIIFDVDGVLVVNKQVFSEIYSEKHNIPTSAMSPFFTGPFKNCLTGKSDLKDIMKQPTSLRSGFLIYSNSLAVCPASISP